MLDVLFVGGIFALLERGRAGRGFPAIARARVEPEDAEKLPPSPQPENFPQSSGRPANLFQFIEDEHLCGLQFFSMNYARAVLQGEVKSEAVNALDITEKFIIPETTKLQVIS